MATTTIRPIRSATPRRWQAALARALNEGIQVRQLSGSGQWIATSGSNLSAAYTLDVTGAVAHGCDCPAGSFGDPCCKHRAAYYHAMGTLDLEPEPPAPVAPITELATLKPGWAICRDCGRAGMLGSTRPVPAHGVRCPACRTAASPVSLPPPDDRLMAELLLAALDAKAIDRAA